MPTPMLSEWVKIILNTPVDGIDGRGEYADTLTECRADMYGERPNDM